MSQSISWRSVLWVPVGVVAQVVLVLGVPFAQSRGWLDLSLKAGSNLLWTGIAFAVMVPLVLRATVLLRVPEDDAVGSMVADVVIPGWFFVSLMAAIWISGLG